MPPLPPQENQAVHDELRQAVEEKESLKLKVQEYAQSILRYEEAISVKASQLHIVMVLYEDKEQMMTLSLLWRRQ